MLIGTQRRLLTFLFKYNFLFRILAPMHNKIIIGSIIFLVNLVGVFVIVHFLLLLKRVKIYRILFAPLYPVFRNDFGTHGHYRLLILIINKYRRLLLFFPEKIFEERKGVRTGNNAVNEQCTCQT